MGDPYAEFSHSRCKDKPYHKLTGIETSSREILRATIYFT
jgi:hypothetical protein